MSETLYDLLGVDRSASESEIRGAWRSLVTVLGPTDHRFGAINDAASVLLDADKRTAYDATLAAETETQAEPEPSAAEAEPEPSAAETEPELEPSAPEPEQTVIVPTPAARAGVSSSFLGRLAAPRVTLVAVILAVFLIVATALSYLLQDDGAKVSGRTVTINLTDVNVKPIQQQVSTRETPDVTAALAAAVAAAPKVLDFDYRTIGTWQATATPYMTPTFAKSYLAYFNAMFVPNVKRVHGVEKLSPILDAGVVSTAPGTVQVLLLFDAQTSTTNQTVVAQNFATLTMVNLNGRWLVDKFGTAPIAK